MAFLNETVVLAVVGLLGASVIVGTVVVSKKMEPQEVSVIGDRNKIPVPIKKPDAPPPALPPPPPVVVAMPPLQETAPVSQHVKDISKEIMEENPSLSEEEIEHAVEKAHRLDQIEQAYR